MEKKLRRTIFLATGLSVFVVLLTLAMPFNMIMLFRWVIPSESIASIRVIAGAALAALVFMVIFDVLRFALLRRFSIYLDQALGEKLLLGMFRDRAMLQKSDSATAMDDLNKVRQFVGAPTALAFLDAMISPLQLAIVFMLSPLMGFLATVCILIILGTKLSSRHATRELMKNSNQLFSKVNNFAQECVLNAQAIQSMGMQPQLTSKWRKMQNEMVLGQTEASEKAGVHSAISKSMGWIMQVLLMGVGFSMILAGTMDSGFMIIAVIIAGRVIMPMQAVVSGWEEYQQAGNAFSRLKEFVEELEKNRRAVDLELPEPSGNLTAASLSFGMGGKSIISNISFDIAAGTTLGIIGPSGAGKSTLVRIITGSVLPGSGILRLDGADMHQWDQDRLGGYIGYLPQEVELFSGTIARNISRFQEVDLETVREAARRAGLDEIIMGLPDGYETFLEEKGRNLPGGLRQRIGMARALFGSPRIVIVDEPDANLDARGLEGLQQILEQLKQDRVTTILVTHRLQLLTFTDNLLMLKDGKTHLYGPTREVLTKLLPPGKAR